MASLPAGGIVTRLSAAIADRCRIEHELGAGGMATVYLAHDLKHDRDVAIKVLHADLGAVTAKTGKTPEQLKAAAEKTDIHQPDMKATTLIEWLRSEYELGRGHSMSVWAVWKSKGWVEAAKRK